MMTARSIGWGMAAAVAFCWVGGVQAADMDMEWVEFKAPEKWVSKTPKVSIIRYEYHAPKVEGDDADGRFTVMAAGGGTQANIDRWIGQFSQPDGKETKDRAKVSKKEIAGTEVHLVDISGTFKDQPGPFAPAVEKEKYRMLAAIVTSKKGQVFLKFYGPQKTIAEHEGAFNSMVENLKSK